MYKRKLLKPATIVATAALSMLAGCGSGDDEAVSEEPPEMTNVEPYEATAPEDPPRLGDTSPEGSAGSPAIDPRDPVDEVMQPADEKLFANAAIAAASGSGVAGEMRFVQEGTIVQITGTITGLAPGEHGLHIHTQGDCSAPDATSAQGHFAPDGDPHGSPESPDNLHHVGDLGNITANENGVANFDMTDAEMTLETGLKSVVGRAVIIHADADDMISQPSGAAGARVGCGVIELNVSPAYTGS